MLYWRTEYFSTKSMFDALPLTAPKYLAISPMKYMKKAFGYHIEILLFRGFVDVEQRDENEWPLKIKIKDALNFKMQLKSFFSILTSVEMKTMTHHFQWNFILQFKLLSPTSSDILQVVTSKAIKNGCTLLHTSVLKSLINEAPLTNPKCLEATIDYATMLTKGNTSTVQTETYYFENLIPQKATTLQDQKKRKYSQVLTTTKSDLSFILNC